MDSDIEAVREALEFCRPDGVYLPAIAALSRLAARLEPVDLTEFEGATEGPWSLAWDFSIIPTAHEGQPMGGHVNDTDDRHIFAQKIAHVQEDRHGRGDRLATGKLLAAAPRLLREWVEARARIATLEDVAERAINSLEFIAEATWDKRQPDQYRHGCEQAAEMSSCYEELRAILVKTETSIPNPVPVKAPYRVTEEPST